MTESTNLKKLKIIWGQACNTMWLEIAATRTMEAKVKSDWHKIDERKILSDFYFVGESRGRIRDCTKKYYLENLDGVINYMATIRIVMLSAAFESFWDGFLDDFINSKSRYCSNGIRNDRGNKVYGEIQKSKGMRGKLERWSDITQTRIESIKPHLDMLNDVYMARNIIAHDAGVIEKEYVNTLKFKQFNIGDALTVKPNELLTMANSVINIAEILDGKVRGK